MEDARVLSSSKFHDYPRIEYLKILPTAYYQFEVVSILMNFVLYYFVMCDNSNSRSFQTKYPRITLFTQVYDGWKLKTH